MLQSLHVCVFVGWCRKEWSIYSEFFPFEISHIFKFNLCLFLLHLNIVLIKWHALGLQIHLVVLRKVHDLSSFSY